MRRRDSVIEDEHDPDQDARRVKPGEMSISRNKVPLGRMNGRSASCVFSILQQFDVVVFVDLAGRTLTGTQITVNGEPASPPG